MNREKLAQEAKQLFSQLPISFIQERYEESGIAIECENGSPETMVFE